MAFVVIFSAVALGIIAGLAAYFLIRWFGVKRFSDSLQTSLFLIKVPRTLSEEKNKSETKDLKSEIAHFEELLGGLSAFKKPFSFEIAVPHVGEEITFYLAVPKLMAEVAAKQIQGLWNGASVELLRDDFNIFNVHGATAAGFVAQKDSYALPIRTYAELGIDSFESILGTLAKINEIGEGVALQVVIRPAMKDATKSIRKHLELLKKGESAKKVLGNGFSVSLRMSTRFLFRRPKRKKQRKKASAWWTKRR